MLRKIIAIFLMTTTGIGLVLNAQQEKMDLTLKSCNYFLKEAASNEGKVVKEHNWLANDLLAINIGYEFIDLYDSTIYCGMTGDTVVWNESISLVRHSIGY